MPDPVCPGDSEPQPSAPLIYYATDADYAAAWGDWWRLLRPWFGLNPEFPHSVAELCANPPVGPFDIDPTDLVAALRGDKVEWFNVFTVINERLKWHLWNTYCQCEAAPMLPGADCYDATALSLNPWFYHRLVETSGTVAEDEGSIGQDGTYIGGVTLAQAGPFADRVAARFTTGSPQGTVEVRGYDATGIGRVALSAWIFPVNYHTSPSNLQIIQTYESGSGSGALVLQLRIQASNATTGTLRAIQAFKGGLSTEFTAGSIPVNQWSHVALSYTTGGILSVYINGIVGPSGSVNQGSNGPADAGRYYDISQDSVGWFDGRIYGAMVSPPLTATQVANLYAAGLTSCDQDAPAGPVEEPEVPDVPPELPLPPVVTCDEEDLCAALDQLRLDVAYVRNQLDVVQRQAAPFGHQLVETWVATESGSRTVRGLIGLVADPTVWPATKGQRGSVVKDYFDLGYVSLGTASGWGERIILRHDPQWIEVRGDVTVIGYDLAPGVAVTFKSYRRLN